MPIPRLLDLFCGAGGAAFGYQRAGFYVVGVDSSPQPRYKGDEFILADALDTALDGFDMIHASPPCQRYSISRNNGCHADAPNFVPTILSKLLKVKVPWVIENVPGAPLPSPITLCGASFGLGASGFDLNRHRLFETNFDIQAPPCCHKQGKTIGVYGNGTNSWHRKKFGRCITIKEMREAMGINWMTRKELSQAVPPAYTEWIGDWVILSELL